MSRIETARRYHPSDRARGVSGVPAGRLRPPGTGLSPRGIRSRAVRVEVETPRASPFARPWCSPSSRHGSTRVTLRWRSVGCRRSPSTVRSFGNCSVTGTPRPARPGGDGGGRGRVAGAGRGPPGAVRGWAARPLRRSGTDRSEIGMRFEGESGRRWNCSAGHAGWSRFVGGVERWIAVEDVARYRDGLAPFRPAGSLTPSWARRSNRSRPCCGMAITARSQRPDRGAVGLPGADRSGARVPSVSRGLQGHRQRGQLLVRSRCPPQDQAPHLARLRGRSSRWTPRPSVASRTGMV